MNALQDNGQQQSSRTPANIVWNVAYVVCFMICFAGTTYQVLMILNLYFSYPCDVSVGIITKENITLPGITFCSSIGVKRSGLETMDGFKEELESLERQEGDNNVTSKEKQQLMIKYYFKFIETTPLDSMIEQGLNFSEFIKVAKTECALDNIFDEKGFIDSNATKCRDYLHSDFIETFQGTSICWTLFHESIENKLTQVQVQSGETQSPVFIDDIESIVSASKIKREYTDEEQLFGEKEAEDQPIQPLEVIRFMVNFSQKESVEFDKPALGSVSVHDPDQIRLGRLQSITLRNGQHYEIYIEEQESRLLQYPYETDCYPYTQMRDRAIKGRTHRDKPGHPLLLDPLSANDCLYGCLGNETLKKCGCWPPEIPYVRTKGYDTGFSNVFIKNSVKVCGWFRKGQSELSNNLTGEDAAMSVYYSCIASREIVKKCSDQCHAGCRSSRIKSTFQNVRWPSSERIKFALNQTDLLYKFRNCCSIVSVRLASNEITIYTYSPKYEMIEFISYIGGIVSLWLGFTFIGIFDYFKCIVKFFVKKTSKSTKKKKEDQRRRLDVKNIRHD